jgi:hypothetical protein
VGAAGARIEAAVGAGGLSRGEMRELIQAMVADGVDAAERDLLTEIASGEALTLTLDGGRSIAFPKPADDVVMLAGLVTATPNLNTLWCRPMPHSDLFFELARLSPAAQHRLYSYIGNVLDDAWKISTLRSQFVEYTRQLNCGWEMIQTLPEDKEARGLAYDLLIAGVATGIDKAKAEGASAVESLCLDAGDAAGRDSRGKQRSAALTKKSSRESGSDSDSCLAAQLPIGAGVGAVRAERKSCPGQPAKPLRAGSRRKSRCEPSSWRRSGTGCRQKRLISSRKLRRALRWTPPLLARPCVWVR